MSMKILLEALPPPGKPMSVVQLSGKTGLDRKAVARFCGKLLHHGFVDRPETGVYRLNKNGLEARQTGAALTSGPKGKLTGVRRKKKTTDRDRVWRCLRGSGGAITVPEIQAMTAIEKANSVQSYLRHLTNAGFVAKLGRRVQGTKLTSNGFVQYLLIRNTGPLTPYMRDGAMVDPNTGDGQ